MLSEEEEKFLLYWEQNRTKKKSIRSQLSMGLPIGLLIGVGILLNFVSGWYTRANMVANSQSTPLVIIIAIILIALFCSVFYKRHKWEMDEQRYLELMYKKKSENKS
jgi:cbb3-type cytochrome oxidase subunit 3